MKLSTSRLNTPDDQQLFKASVMRSEGRHVELKFVVSINKMKSALNFAIDESLIC